MFDLKDVFMLLVLAVCAALVWRATEVREYAVLAVKRHLRRLDLQLLDDTVAWRGWQRRGGRLLRVYQFEFSSMGNERYGGMVNMSGFRVVDIVLEAYRVERPEHEALH